MTCNNGEIDFCLLVGKESGGQNLFGVGQGRRSNISWHINFGRTTKDASEEAVETVK